MPAGMMKATGAELQALRDDFLHMQQRHELREAEYERKLDLLREEVQQLRDVIRGRDYARHTVPEIASYPCGRE